MVWLVGRLVWLVSWVGLGLLVCWLHLLAGWQVGSLAGCLGDPRSGFDVARLEYLHQPVKQGFCRNISRLGFSSLVWKGASSYIRTGRRPSVRTSIDQEHVLLLLLSRLLPNGCRRRRGRAFNAAGRWFESGLIQLRHSTATKGSQQPARSTLE